jgi:hypothetical protein
VGTDVLRTSRDVILRDMSRVRRRGRGINKTVRMLLMTEDTFHFWGPFYTYIRSQRRKTPPWFIANWVISENQIL